MTERMRVAITGGSGLVAEIVRNHLEDRFDFVPLSRDDADVTDLDALEHAFAGADAVLHLGANPNVDAEWDELREPNLDGAYHAYEAARRAGVRRVVFASSNHAMGGYILDDDRFADPNNIREVSADDPVRPDSLYGASKAWGEAIGRFYAEHHGLEVVCLRIGWVTDDDTSPDPDAAEVPGSEKVAQRSPGMWLTHADCASLVEAALTADVRFAIVNGVSDVEGRWFSLDEGRRLLGWQPEDPQERQPR
jgi:nucleoside-diphosphate-sugar epimerase